MATTAQRRGAPVQLWIVGILALLWSAFGCYDYWMTVTANAVYLSKMPADAITYMNGLPKWTTAMWALGVWGGLLGSILLLARSHFAVWAYGVSFIGAIVGLGYQMFMTQHPASMNAGGMAVMPWVIIAFCAFLLWYSWNAERKGVIG
jgi:hypothetical protein